MRTCCIQGSKLGHFLLLIKIIDQSQASTFNKIMFTITGSNASIGIFKKQEEGSQWFRSTKLRIRTDRCEIKWSSGLPPVDLIFIGRCRMYRLGQTFVRADSQ